MFGRIDSAVKKVGWLMDNQPQEWNISDSQYYVEHIPSGIKIWIGNEMRYIDFHPLKGSLSNKEQKFLKAKIKQLLCHRITDGSIRPRSVD